MVSCPVLRSTPVFITYKLRTLYLYVGPLSANQRDLETRRWVRNLLVHMDEARCDASSFNNVAIELNKKSATSEYFVIQFSFFVLISHILNLL